MMWNTILFVKCIFVDIKTTLNPILIEMYEVRNVIQEFPKKIYFLVEIKTRKFCDFFKSHYMKL